MDEPPETPPVPDPVPPVVPDEPQPVPEPPPAVVHGTIAIASEIANGRLWINGEDRGPLTNGMTVDLPPGPYRLEARNGEDMTAEARVDLAAGARANAELNTAEVADP